jgi:hypothetical protein
VGSEMCIRDSFISPSTLTFCELPQGVTIFISATMKFVEGSFHSDRLNIYII